jgi:uncharacterized protein YlaI
MKECEICEIVTYLDSHHIESKSYSGVDAVYNKAHICPTCHRRVHMGDIVLEGKFQTTLGIKLIWHEKGEKSITGNEPRVYVYGRK